VKESELELQLLQLDSLQSACIGCGLCLEVCATYQASGWEHESPRGRIQMARQLLDNKIEATSEALASFDRCLGCRACEVVCPTQVHYRSLRAIVQDIRQHFNSQKIINTQQLSHFKLACKISNRYWRRYGSKWINFDSLTLPKLSDRVAKKKLTLSSKNSINLVVGCLQDLYQRDMIAQTIRVLDQLNIGVDLQTNQNCCGAIFERINSSQAVQIYQNKCTAKFKKKLLNPSVFLATGCKNYLFNQQISVENVLDLYELIYQKLNILHIPLKLENSLTVYYQPYCSQKGKDAALQLLASIENLKILSVWPAKSCCGGFCGEPLFHSEQAKFLRESKWGELPKNATVVVTSADCWLQLSQIEGVQVVYPLELIERCFNGKEI